MLTRADLPTPALVLDRPALLRNIARMADFTRSRGIALRPHAKTHKSADIARVQLDAGAVGLCCAKLGEAEALAAEGIGDIHLTSPVVAAGAIARLAALQGRISLSVVVDHPDNVAALGQAIATTTAAPLAVVIDVDPGPRRTGVASVEAAVELAHAIAAQPTLRLAGVQFYCGSDQHIVSHAERAASIGRRTDYLRTVLAALADAGRPIDYVTGGGTGSFMIDAELGVLTELQCGSYIVLDREYADCDLTGGDAPAFEAALFVDATVVSANHPGMVTIDAGLKAMATDAGPPTVASGAPGATYTFTGDEHGALRGPSLPPLGGRVALLTPHCDPTVNLYDAYQLVEDDQLVAVWPVTARGRST